MNILYEDNHVLVLDKPGGLLTQPTHLEEDSLVVRARAFIKQRDDKPGRVFLEPIHRIDKAVSGIVVFAKTSKALSRLTKAIREKRCTKIYRALVCGKMAKKEATLTHNLVHSSYRAEIAKDGKVSTLHYKVLKQLGAHTLLEVTLETGRYHQIRIQLASTGHPIVGDTKYGSQEVLPNGTIALQHYQFSFPHPITDDIITVKTVATLQIK